MDPPSLPYRPLPTQPAEVPWPTEAWPTASSPEPVDLLVDEMFADRDRFGETFSVLVVHQGRLVHERYGGELEHWDRDDEPVTTATPLLSWSMAKSVTHALVGLLLGDRALALEAPAPVAAWRAPDDPRREITLEHLLEMRDGLDFFEDYVDDRASDVIEMLFGSGKADVATFAAGRPLAHEPGAVFNYSSGTSNIVARVVGDTVGGGPDGLRRFMHDRLFGPIGVTSAQPRFDDAGTFVGSSYLYMTARDWARFGLLYLRDGVWEGRRVLPEGWVDHGRRARSVDPTDGRLYGAHWWVVGDEHGSFRASGYEGQSILCVPTLDLLVVRLGKTPESLDDQLTDWRARVTRAFG
jgi:CubicO group peptidase (beta-lactamase class C family)